MKRSGFLKRKTPLRAKGGFIKKGGRLRATAKRKEGDRRAYTQEAAQFIRDNPHCQAHKKVSCVLLQTTEEQLVLIPVPSSEVHHMAGREGRLLRDQRHWLATCRECHSWIHANGRAAREIGLLYED